MTGTILLAVGLAPFNSTTPSGSALSGHRRTSIEGNGSVTIKRALGGCTADVRLPAQKEISAKRSVKVCDVRNLDILLVEDDERVRRTLTEMLVALIIR